VLEFARLGKGRLQEIAWSPGGNLLAVAVAPGIWLYDTSTWQNVRFIETGSAVHTMALSPDGEIVASAGPGDIELRRVSDGALIRVLVGHWGYVEGLAFSPRGDMLASGSSDDDTVRLWQVNGGTLLQTLRGNTQGVWSVAFSPDGNLVAAGGYDGIIRMWKIPFSGSP
jgi:WD40 repeat protein